MVRLKVSPSGFSAAPMLTVPTYLPTIALFGLERSHNRLEEFGPSSIALSVHASVRCWHRIRPPARSVLRDCSTREAWRSRTLVAGTAWTAMPTSTGSPAHRLSSPGGPLTDQTKVALDLFVSV